MLIEILNALFVMVMFTWLLCYLLFLWLWEYPKIRRPVQNYFLKRKLSKRDADSDFLLEGGVMNDHVERVGYKIAEAAGCLPHSIVFRVFSNKYPRAFARRPNIVAISTGMCKQFRNEDEMAAVLAHEVGHIVLCQEEGWTVSCLEDYRIEEYKADHLAIRYVRKAGYDPAAAGRLQWRKMGYLYRRGLSLFHDDQSSTHPTYLKRIRSVNRTIESLS